MALGLFLSTAMLLAETKETTAPKFGTAFFKRFFSALNQIPESDQIDYISRQFLGRPYGYSVPLETHQALFDFSRFNCLTLIETVMAFYHATSMKAAEKRILKLRYLQEILDWTHRKHFMEYHWIPDNIKKGFIKDITLEIAGKRTHRMVKDYSEVKWVGPHQKWLALKAYLPKGRQEIAYIPLAQAAFLIEKIPSGTIVCFLRKPRPQSPILISHMGLIIKKGETSLLRHAVSDSTIYKVLDQDLRRYLTIINHYNRKWPFEGIILLAIL